MGASFVAWMVLAALPPPPTDDGAACQRWAVDEAAGLLQAPQPPASALEGESSGGLSEIPDDVWLVLGAPGYPPSVDGGATSWKPVREGTAPVSSVPILDRALAAAEQPLRRVLVAARGPSNTLPDPWQVWCTLDCPGTRLIDRARYDVPTLALAFGWRSLERGRVEDAVQACVGLAGFLRALAGTGLIGQMLSGSFVHGLSLLCVETTRRVPPDVRGQLAARLEVVEREWPPFSHTMRQELVFGQMIDKERLPSDLRARVPAKWSAVRRRTDSDEEVSWTGGVRSRLFGGWALRERCLGLAVMVEVADAGPAVADSRFQAAQVPTFLGRLAWDDTRGSNWIGFARRVRRLRTELRLLVLALRGSAEGPVIDARTGRPLEVRGAGADRAVVAVADPAFEAEELRLPVSGGTPTRP